MSNFTEYDATMSIWPQRLDLGYLVITNGFSYWKRLNNKDVHHMEDFYRKGRRIDFYGKNDKFLLNFIVEVDKSQIKNWKENKYIDELRETNVQTWSGQKSSNTKYLSKYIEDILDKETIRFISRFKIFVNNKRTRIFDLKWNKRTYQRQPMDSGGERWIVDGSLTLCV